MSIKVTYYYVISSYLYTSVLGIARIEFTIEDVYTPERKVSAGLPGAIAATDLPGLIVERIRHVISIHVAVSWRWLPLLLPIRRDSTIIATKKKDRIICSDKPLYNIRVQI